MTEELAVADQIFKSLDPPLWIVTAAAGKHRGGLLATSVIKSSISPDYPRVLIGLGKIHFTWTLVEESNAFALHLLGPEQVAWVERFGMTTGRDLDKFEGLRVSTNALGVPILLDAPARLECRVEAKFDIGDRTLYLAQVQRGDISIFDQGFQALTFGAAISQISPEAMNHLREAAAQDSLIDAQAIRAWRSSSSDCLLPEDCR